ncbi:MAG: hypothetical protein KFF73_05470 [Cyclobacteriaceae bacterium]|nr:hypothetical protein [Cyclobacteriaceae bacterium]
MKKIWEYIKRAIDIRLGIIGAIFMGSVVAYINSDSGIVPSSIAAMKQALYTFFIGGVIIRILDLIVNNIRKKAYAYLVSITVATLLTTSLVYFVHCMKGTPKPLDSTIATVILAPPGYIFLAYFKRKIHHNPEAEEGKD